MVVARGVQGTYLYDVNVSADKHVIQVSCTCPFFERDLDPCKHIWAALLAAEQSGFLAELEKIAAPHVRGVRLERRRETSSGAQRRPKSLLGLNWKQQLASLRTQLESAAERADAATKADRQLLYFIDAVETMPHGGLNVRVGVRDRKADRAWGKIKAKRLSAQDLPRLADAEDRRILATLLGGQDGSDRNFSSYAYGTALNEFHLTQALWETLLPLMCLTGRCALGQAVIDDEFIPLTWDDDEPWELRLRVALAEGRKYYRATGYYGAKARRWRCQNPSY